MSEGRGYDLTSVDVVEAYDRAMDAAAKLNRLGDVAGQIRQLGVASDDAAVQFVRKAVRGR